MDGPVLDMRRALRREQQGADDRPAGGIAPQRAVGLHHLAVRAHPGGLAAAAGEVPLAGHAIAAGHRVRLAGVGRSPGHHRARVGEDGVHRLRLQERRDQRRTVGDEDVPAHRTVVPADFLDGAQIGPRVHLVAVHRAGQEHAAQPRGVDLRQQGLGDALGALDLVRRGDDGRAQRTGARDRVGGAGVEPADNIHAVPPDAFRAITGAGGSGVNRWCGRPSPVTTR